MARLAATTEFLSEYATLQKPVRKAVDKAIRMFAEATHTGAHLEKINGSKDPLIRTIRVGDFWRGVVLAPKKGDRHTLIHVLPHDDAIAWARNRTASVNERTGVIEFRDATALQGLAGDVSAPADETPPLFAHVGDADMTRLGIDSGVLAAARQMTNEAMLDAMGPYLPESQRDVLVALQSGYTVEQAWADIVAPRIPDEPVDTDDIDAAVERSTGRIALVDGPEDLIALFAKPLALWRVFLHPSQEAVAYRPSYWGSAQVTGGPGTGKTVAALHRVKHLVTGRDLPPRSVLLTTYTRGLADALDRDLTRLLHPAERDAVEVINVDRWAQGVVRAEHGATRVADDAELREWMANAAQAHGCDATAAFLLEEWRQVVLAHAVSDVEGYLTAPRRGRGKGMTRDRKRIVWATLDRFRTELHERGVWTWHTLADEAARLVGARGQRPYRHVVVDEIQDLHPAQWRLLRASVAVGPDDLFLTGDPHQRIYGNHVSLRQVGISVTGRSARLRVNYRTSAEILRWSMGVLGDIAIADLDEGLDSLSGYRSALHGQAPEIVAAPDHNTEGEDLALAIEQWREDGVAPHDIAVVARTNRVARGLARALQSHGIPTTELKAADSETNTVRVGTMHGLKGLEFRCVAVAGVGRHILPLPQAVVPAAEDPVRHALDVQQERCLLFVACTRARERLRVSWSGEPSELLPASIRR
ncbi:UvrD-helicase domain-containing protein [Pseudonocardia alni]|uniref:UvrD-helicase domain-containing protein n=1 Tax=Pseudonocardia alni TaxID=33907 RepID=UPI001AD6FD71|nr:UvrD-helicase domain-containing protein [Pseudonocardia alni]MBO4238581.1 AAA family ATPase [Pseudonocardia alni]